MGHLGWGSVILNILVAPTIALIFLNYGAILTGGLYCGAVIPLLSPTVVYSLIFITAFLYGLIYDESPQRVLKALALGVGSVLSTISLFSVVVQYKAFVYAVNYLGMLTNYLVERSAGALLMFAAILYQLLTPMAVAGTLTGGILSGAEAVILLTAGITMITTAVALYDAYVGRVWQYASVELAALISRALGVGMITPFLVWVGSIAQILLFLPVFLASLGFGLFIVLFMFSIIANPVTAIGALIGAAVTSVIMSTVSSQLAALTMAVANKLSEFTQIMMSAGFAVGILMVVGVAYISTVLVYIGAIIPLAAAAAIVLLVLSPHVHRVAHMLTSVFSFLIVVQYIMTVLSIFAGAVLDVPTLTACAIDAGMRGSFDVNYISACGLCGGPAWTTNETAVAQYNKCVNATLAAMYNGTSTCFLDMARAMSWYGIGTFPPGGG